VWKCLIYSVLWFYCAWLIVFSGRYDYFTRTWGVWEDWEVGMNIPTDIRYLYFVECGFYLHSVYATIYMDAKRKDTGVMLLHHVLTMILITVSYATRYHKIGLLVLFVHDVTDILLEFTKINVYLKNRNKKFYALHDHVSTIGFATFSFAW
jgi:sphingoid base N-stearoyltransferase